MPSTPASTRCRASPLLGFQPLQVDPGALAQAAVLERLAHRLVGVLVVDVLADHGDGDLVDRMLHGIDHRTQSDRSACGAAFRRRRSTTIWSRPCSCSHSGIL
jgi:hypothetical protein